MIDYLVSIIFFLIFILLFFIPKYRQHRDQTSLYNLVSWCVTKDSSLYRCNLPLLTYVLNAQDDLNLPSEYRLSISNDKTTVEELLALFQKELIVAYFEGSLKTLRSKYVISGNHYFMFALNSFLSDHQCDSYINGHDMHKNTLEYNQYGSWGVPLYDACYELSDFGITYHKLYYITYLFCKSSKVLNNKGEKYLHSDSIKKILDVRQINISRI